MQVFELLYWLLMRTRPLLRIRLFNLQVGHLKIGSFQIEDSSLNCEYFTLFLSFDLGLCQNLIFLARFLRCWFGWSFVWFFLWMVFQFQWFACCCSYKSHGTCFIPCFGICQFSSDCLELNDTPVRRVNGLYLQNPLFQAKLNWLRYHELQLLGWLVCCYRYAHTY